MQSEISHSHKVSPEAEQSQSLMFFIRQALSEKIMWDMAHLVMDGRPYVVQQTESRDGDTLTITATVLLARIEDAEVGEFAWVQFPALSGVDMGFYMQDFSTGELIPGKKFERVSDAAWKRVE